MSCSCQLGQQGSWLVLEEAILEIAEHKDACGYAGMEFGVECGTECVIQPQHTQSVLLPRNQHSHITKSHITDPFSCCTALIVGHSSLSRDRGPAPEQRGDLPALRAHGQGGRGLRKEGGERKGRPGHNFDPRGQW